MKTTLHAKSSSGIPHEVVFETAGDSITTKCSCKAGILHQQCKHKRALIHGDDTMLHNSEEKELLRRVLLAPESQQLITLLQTDESALLEIEKQKTRLSAEEKAIKARMGKLFDRGSL